MTEIRRLIDEKTFGELQKMKGRLPNGKKKKRGTKTAPRPVRSQEDKQRQSLDGKNDGGTTKRRRRRRRRNNSQSSQERSEM